MSTANIIVLCSFAAYMVIMIIIGFVSSKGTKNNEDYFLGGRNLGGWTAAALCTGFRYERLATYWDLLVRFTLREQVRYG